MWFETTNVSECDWMNVCAACGCKNMLHPISNLLLSWEYDNMHEHPCITLEWYIPTTWMIRSHLSSSWDLGQCYIHNFMSHVHVKFMVLQWVLLTRPPPPRLHEFLAIKFMSRTPSARHNWPRVAGTQIWSSVPHFFWKDKTSWKILPQTSCGAGTLAL